MTDDNLTDKCQCPKYVYICTCILIGWAGTRSTAPISPTVFLRCNRWRKRQRSVLSLPLVLLPGLSCVCVWCICVSDCVFIYTQTHRHRHRQTDTHTHIRYNTKHIHNTHTHTHTRYTHNTQRHTIRTIHTQTHTHVYWWGRQMQGQRPRRGLGDVTSPLSASEHLAGSTGRGSAPISRVFCTEPACARGP